MTRRQKPKRGVLLLVVLSILVLFVLAGVTFVVVAGHYFRGSIHAGQHELTGDKPTKLLDSAMYQLVRGTTNTRSSLLHHDLLSDLYGNDGLVGRVLNPPAGGAQGQSVRIEFRVDAQLHPDPTVLPERPADYYNGAVITMVSGLARGLSARIIRSQEITGNGAPSSVNSVFSGVLFTEAFVSDQNVILTPLEYDRFVINGVPFNGSGFGYNPSVGHLFSVPDAAHPEVLFRPAWQPHFRFTFAGADELLGDYGGADESYDAVDPQNMFLAKLPPTATSSAEITPSFHQPPLIRYWIRQFQNQFGDDLSPNDLARLLRLFVLRPTQLDHPNFTGSNPAFAVPRTEMDTIVRSLLEGPWDVDNDGDGVMDSVWIDLGLPESSTADGRLYRPLFAILCTDLDGRLNLNVHGNLDQAQRLLYESLESIPTAGRVASSSSSVRTPRGSGYGPPEVNLAAMYGLARLRGDEDLLGEYNRLLQARYVDLAGMETQAGSRPVPGLIGADPLDALKASDVPARYETLAWPANGNAAEPDLGRYASPPDLFGRGALVLDHAGQPLFVDFVNSRGNPGQVDETLNDPYELNVNQPGALDSLFTAGELERLLRRYDVDASVLSRRLLDLAPRAFAGNEAGILSRLVTTHSFHVPVPNVQLSPEMRVPLRSPPRPSPTIAYWMQQRLLDNGVAEADIPRQLRLMLPFEIRHGQKMDINRLWADTLNDFGRGDSNGDGTIDAENAMDLAMNTVLNRSGGKIPSNYRNDDESALGDSAATRQMFARHLYCLAMMLMDRDYVHPTISNANNLTPQQARELTARRMAQWAINVVDFRDADAIMTPFEYDWNPMNGWQEDIDGDPATPMAPAVDPQDQRRVVWGCEYPHLLLTETLAFHDTRLIDSNLDADPDPKKGRDDNNNGKRDIDEDNPEESEDDDLDQFRIPQGSFFAELYCAYDANNRHPSGTTRVPPRELYRFDEQDSQWKLDLGRVPPQQRGDGVYPVWRLAISEPHVSDQSVYDRLRARPDTTTLEPEQIDLLRDERILIDRVVWFTHRPPTVGQYEEGRIFWNWLPQGGMPTLLAGKQYAVVGPRQQTLLGSSKDASGAGTIPSDRLIALDGVPQGNTFLTSPPYPAIGTEIQRPIGIVAAMDPPISWGSDPNATGDTPETAPYGIGVNISEPLPSGTRYYKEPDHRINNPTLFPLMDAYASKQTGPFPDQPYDQRDGRPLKELGLLGEGTAEDVRTVFLQRLANPLRPWNPPPGTVDPVTGRSWHQENLPVNPYITVDWMPVDLTVFNGEDRPPEEDEPPGLWTDEEPWNFPHLFDEEPRQFRFSTRERGDDQQRDVNVLKWQVPPELRKTTPVGPRDDFFRDRLVHTLGYLNSTYEPRRPPSSGHYVGDPQQPFPWLTWNDRPYANHLELMLVPATSPSRLLLEFTTDTGDNPYRGKSNENVSAPYQHLLNFFHSSKSPMDLGQDLNQLQSSEPSPNLHRLLELVEVPSRFVGTERWYNPAHFLSQQNEFNPLDRAAFTFRPPFNRLSRFRDPGRVNINTIFDIRVWQAIADGFPTKSTPQFWDDFVRSRRGYDLQEQEMFPTEFANPFRSSLGADLHFRLLEMNNMSDVEATLLRSYPSGRSNTPRSLFEYESRGAGNDGGGNLYDDTEQNPYFRYQFLRRLANIASTHSNVYAVWITVGYFEVDPQTSRLGQELNGDTGDVERHRSFYIIDRSIPVAFERGENHNVDRAVLLRRFIE